MFMWYAWGYYYATNDAKASPAGAGEVPRQRRWGRHERLNFFINRQ